MSKEDVERQAKEDTLFLIKTFSKIVKNYQKQESILSDFHKNIVIGRAFNWWNFEAMRNMENIIDELEKKNEN